MLDCISDFVFASLIIEAWFTINICWNGVQTATESFISCWGVL